MVKRVLIVLFIAGYFSSGKGVSLQDRIHASSQLDGLAVRGDAGVVLHAAGRVGAVSTHTEEAAAILELEHHELERAPRLQREAHVGPLRVGQFYSADAHQSRVARVLLCPEVPIHTRQRSA